MRRSILDRTPGELLLVIGGVSVQGGASLAVRVMQRQGPLAAVALRTAFSALMLLVVRRPPLRGVSGRAWRSAIALGVVLCLLNSSFYASLARIPLGVAVTIEFWGPLAVAVLGSRRPRDLLWVALAALGIYLFAADRLFVDGRFAAEDGLGILFALAAGGAWALYVPTGGRLARDWPDGRGLTVSMVVSSALLVPAAFIVGGLSTTLASPEAVVAMVVVALFSSTIPYTLEIAALGRLSGHTYGVLTSLEPAIAAAVGFVALGQVLRPQEIVAIALVIAASVGASLTARSRRVVPGELEAE